MEKAMQQEETLAKEEAVEVELPAEEEKEEESQKEKLEVVEEQPTEDKSEQEEYSEGVQKRINSENQKDKVKKLLLGLKKYKKRMKNLRKKPILLIQQCFLNMTIEYLLS
jgi:hypothetical protein